MKIAALPHESTEMVIPIDVIGQQRIGLDNTDKATQHRGQDKTGSGAQGDGEDISLQKLQHVTDAVSSYLSSMGVHFNFVIDDRTDRVQVEVREPDTDKLICKIPADEMLDLAVSMEKMVGLFLDKTL